MATRIYLTDTDSDVSGYKLAMIGSRSPFASTSAAVAVTGTDNSGTDVALTATSGGTALAWITQTFESDVTVAGAVVMNFWGRESAASANASLGFKLFEYTTAEQSVFCQASYGTELGTTASQIQISRQPAADGTVQGGAYTSTTIDAGNRLVIKPIVTNVGTMLGGQSVEFQYNDATPGSSGDSFIELTETVNAGEVQLGDGLTQPLAGGPSQVKLQEMVQTLTPVIKAVLSEDAAWNTVANEFENMLDVGTA